jgi:uncharacterized protein
VLRARLVLRRPLLALRLAPLQSTATVADARLQMADCPLPVLGRQILDYAVVVSAAVRISIRVKPRASRSRVLRAEGLDIEASLAAPPVDGAANAELIELLASVLAVSKSSLRLVQGEKAKNKLVELKGLSVDEATTRLAAAVR